MTYTILENSFENKIKYSVWNQMFNLFYIYFEDKLIATNQFERRILWNQSKISYTNISVYFKISSSLETHKSTSTINMLRKMKEDNDGMRRNLMNLANKISIGKNIAEEFTKNQANILSNNILSNAIGSAYNSIDSSLSQNIVARPVSSSDRILTQLLETSNKQLDVLVQLSEDVEDIKINVSWIMFHSFIEQNMNGKLKFVEKNQNKIMEVLRSRDKEINWTIASASLIIELISTFLK